MSNSEWQQIMVTFKMFSVFMIIIMHVYQKKLETEQKSDKFGRNTDWKQGWTKVQPSFTIVTTEHGSKLSAHDGSMGVIFSEHGS